MKNALRLLAVLIFALALPAQPQTGQVRGRVLDKAGKPVAGAKVTLENPALAVEKAVTGEAGVFRFLAVRPGPGYVLKAEREEFKTASRAGIVVETGGRVDVDLVIEPGKPEETVAVTAPTPMIDRARFTAGASFGGAELQVLPTARDPWVVLQLVPSVLVDRENVGGNESSEQSQAVARGADTHGAANTWMVDGIDVSGPVVLGESAVHYDFDAIDTIAVTTGGAADVTQQTGGIAVNILTRRGGNKIGGSARFFLTDHAFQSDNLTSELRGGGVHDTNRIEQIRDYGASLGGAIVKNRLWLWGDYGVQDLFTYSIFDVADRTLFGHASVKLNAALFAGNTFEALFTASQKERYGADADPSKPEGNHLTGRFRLGSPIFKIQDEQTIGRDLHLAAKLTWTNTGAVSRPMLDEDMLNPVAFDVAQGVYVPFADNFVKSWDYSQSVQKRKSVQILGTLFKDSLLGMAHEFKAGLEFTDKRSTTASGNPQNYQVFRNFTEPLIDLGQGLVVPPADWQRVAISRENRRVALADQASAFLQDTFTAGRFTFQLGLRYDHQKPSLGAVGISSITSSWSNAFTSTTMSALATYLPALAVNPVESRYAWSTWSPRVGVSWDLKGDGKTVLKLAFAQYGDILAAGANTPVPLGLDGKLNFWWNDADDDWTVDATEVYWKHASTHATAPNQLYGLFDSDGNLTAAAGDALEGGFESDAFLAGNYQDYDWANRGVINYDNLTTFYRSDIDPGEKNVKTSPRTREIMLSLEKELRPDLAASVTATYRRYDNFDWAKPFYPADLYPSTPDLVIDNTGTWYEVAGTIPNTVEIDDRTIDMGEAAGRSWYLPIASYPGATPYRMVDKSTAYKTYIGLDLAVTKRLSNRWFLNASVTLQDQRAHWGDSFIDPTNQWALDGRPYGNIGSGGSGKIWVQMYSRWMAKVSALYQLPLGFDVAATYVAREGWKIPHYLTLAYADPGSWPGLYRSNTVYVQPTTKDSLPVFGNLTLRIEKKISLGNSRMYLLADVFNLLNSAVVNRAYDAYHGIYYADTEASAGNVFDRLYNEVLNPRVFRLGVRFEF